ncbi:MAG: S-malonyltransferase [Bacteroidota bacterium]|jgi:[acyl-carrier-protein] S-malonyltransferase
MMNAYLFPGQGAQFPGMGKDLYVGNPQAKILFEKANECLGFRITDVMFEGTKEELQQTQVTQPAVFIHSVILAKTTPHFQPAMVAGHSLGELSALVASQVLTFEAGLQLVAQRAKAMQAACELAPGAMAAILGLSDEKVAQVCASIDELVVPTNYNCPGQLVISGTHKGITLACEAMETAGSLGTILLPVSGAFHSLLMEPAKQQFARAISQTKFQRGICPIYQNVNATPTTAPELIQEHLMEQLTAPVRWTQTIRCMIQDGAQLFIECGPGKTLQGLVRKIDKHVQVASL